MQIQTCTILKNITLQDDQFMIPHCGISGNPSYQPFVGDHHFHFLLRSTVSMTHHCYHTTQLQSGWQKVQYFTSNHRNLLISYSELALGMGTGTSSAKYSTDGRMLGNNSGASFEKIVSLHKQKNIHQQ